jgi:hypothetical protein
MGKAHVHTFFSGHEVGRLGSFLSGFLSGFLLGPSWAKPIHKYFLVGLRWAGLVRF